MNISFASNRSPVKREGGETYVLLMLVSFAASVILTRLFLELTGYPQLGNSELHIAHVLWGGLLLFIGSLLPLIFANRWFYTTSAILSGTGVGLFIDEVGKFITQNNDYFYPFAAPIIYAFFLLTVLVYLQVRRSNKEDARANLYRAFDLMAEVIDHNLDPVEQDLLKARLQRVLDMNVDESYQHIAQTMLDLLNDPVLERAKVERGGLSRWLEQGEQIVTRYLTHQNLRRILVIAMSLLAISSVVQLTLLAVILVAPSGLEQFIAQILQAEERVRSEMSVLWFIVLILLDGLVGLIFGYAAFALLRNRNLRAARLGFLALTLSLTTINLLLFYYSQFAAVSSTLFQFVVLLCLIRYRRLQSTVSA